MAPTRSLGAAEASVRATLEEWGNEGRVARLWNRDASLWTGGDEDRWLGWLRIVDAMLADLAPLEALAADVRAAGFTHALLLGMGGSSLCPEVLRLTFGAQPGFPRLHVLDSTVPAQVAAAGRAVDPARTLCIVASKSGSTVEPNVMKAWFWERVREATGADPGRHFVAITDPGTQMERIAKEGGFRRILYGVPEIGGRFSALSSFGMTAAAVLGLDVRDFLLRAQRMARACGPETRAAENPGLVLGVILGVLAREGRDKVTIVASPPIASLGAWLEQLLAESTGKHGKGLVPVADEALGVPALYGGDRVFVYVRTDEGASAAQDRAVDTLEGAGQPVVRLSLASARDLGAELFRWEIATAVAGAVLGIHPFDQPDVESAKVATRRLMSVYEETGALPHESPLHEEAGLRVFADARNARAVEGAPHGRSVEALLRRHFARLRPGDYFALQAYLDMNADVEARLQRLRHAVRDAKGVATTLGFGPRFLHSTGQLHKGGPDSGVFLQLTSDVAEDVAIPGQRASFGVLARAQAQGDLEVLGERGRRALRVHLPAGVPAALDRLTELAQRALHGLEA
jgi:transaldolase/glucose-6-phosphate isomerase